MSGNVVSNEDYLVIKLHKNLPMNVSKSTYDKIQKSFDSLAINMILNGKMLLKCHKALLKR